MMQAKGPNALNIHAYMNGDEEEGEYMEEGASSRPNIDVKSIEDQFDNFVKDMQKYDEILSNVAKNIEEIDGQGQFITDFYPKFIWESTYQQDQQKRIVANTDPELAKIIHSLEKNNRNFKVDMRSWVLEFAKTARLTEVLIGENKILRQSITKKNKEIVKLIEEIGQAENEEITQLAENLEVLREENGVLKEHLNHLKDEVNAKRRQQERILAALDKTNQEKEELKKAKDEAEDEQQHLSKTFQLIQQWKNQTEKRKKRLQRQKQFLIHRKQQLGEQKGKIQRELSLCSKEKSELENGLRRQYQEKYNEKYRYLEEIHNLGDKISKYKMECKYYEQQNVRNTNNKQQYEKLAKQYQQKVSENQQLLKVLRKELESTQQAEIAVQCSIQIQKYDIDVLKRELQELEDKEKKINQEWKKTLKRTDQSKNKEIAQWQSKINQNQRELAMKIMQERTELNTRQKQLERWEQKVYEKKEELTDLKGHLKEIKQNQAKLADLKSKLKQSQQ